MVATWTGAVSNDWSDGDNWSPAVVPGVGDAIIIPASPSGGRAPEILDGETVSVYGNIANGDVITLASTGDQTNFVVNGQVTLSGAGTLTLTDSAANRIYSNTTGSTLDNQETIEGAGEIFSNGKLSLINDTAGVINANGVNALDIHNISFTNDGTVAAGNGGTLEIDDALTNISADSNHTGGSVLTGGIYNVVDQNTSGDGPGAASTIAISGNGATEITTLAATVDLAGQASQLTADGVSLVNSLLEVADNGDLNLYYGFNSGTSQNFADPNAVTIDQGGQVSVTGADFSTAGLTIASGGYLLASGEFDGAFSVYASIQGPIVNNGLMAADGVEAGAVQPTAYFGGPISGAGAIDLDQDAIAEFGGGVGAGQTIYFGNNPVLSSTQVAGEETIRIDSTSVDPRGSGSNNFAATIANFNLGDAIDLSNFDDETDYTFNGATLTVDFVGDRTATLTLAGDTATTFHFTSDGDGGTLITQGTSAELANDTGASATDGVTNDPAVTGTGDPDATLIFTEGDATLGTTAVDGNGLWSFTPTGLEDGVQTIVVSEASGNFSTEVGSVTFALATQAPSATASQTLSGVTNKTTDTISGVATAEDVAGNGINAVEIIDLDDDVVRFATLGTGGAYSATLTGLTDGGHNFEVLAIDTAGNLAPTLLSDVIIATQAPTVTASESVSGTTTETDDFISATATPENSAHNSIASVIVFDGATELGAASDSEGTWIYTASNLALGPHDFSLVTTDAAGNSTTTTLAPVDVVSSSSPIVNASISTPGLTNQTSETISETATAVGDDTIVGVEVYDNGKDLGAASFNSQTQTWDFTASGLADGENDFSTVTSDSDDNQTTTTLPVVDIATEAPVNGSPSESISGVTNKTGETISVTPSVEDVTGNGVASVEIVDTSTDTTTAATLGAGGVYSATLTGLGDGAHVFDIVTTDKAGNSTTTALTAVDIATHAPTMSASESVSGTTTQTSDVLSATVTAEDVPGDSIVSVVAFDGETELGAATLSNGVWRYTASNLSTGGHTFSLVATDAAGNSMTKALAPVDVVSGAGPTVHASISTPGLTNQTSETISETATASTGNTITSVEVFNNSVDLGAASFNSDTRTWSFTASGLANGANDFSTVTTDSADNATTTELPVVDIATQPPVNGSPSESVSGVTNKTSETISVTPTVENVSGNGVASVEIVDTSTDTTTAATLGAGGVYSATLTGLGDGAHVFDIVTTDKAGNQTTTALTAVDIATQAPAMNASESVSGTTTQTSDVLSATVTVENVPGNSIASVLAYDGETELGAATLSNGFWSYTASDLALGGHTFSLVATDAAGNSTTKTLAPVDVVSGVHPTVNASISTPGLTNQTSETITETATASAGNTITGVEVFDNDTDLGAASFHSDTQAWSFTASGLTDGAHDFSTVTTDSDDNQTTTALPVVDIATQPPVNGSPRESVSGITNKNSETIAVTPTVEDVSGNGVSSVEIVDTSTDTTTAATLGDAGVYSATLTGLGDGAHVFDIVTTDKAGNQTTAALTAVDIATQAPAMNARESVSGTTTQTSDVLTATVTAQNVPGNSIVSVLAFDDETEIGAATLSNGVWSYTASDLSLGGHTLSLVATDAAGNSTTKMLAPVNVVSGAAPTVSASISAPGLTNQTSETISETATAVEGNTITGVEVFDNEVDLGAASFNSDSQTWSFTANDLADGENDFSTVTTDSGDNQTTTALPVVDIATHAPVNGSPSENISGITNQTSETISVTPTVENVPGNGVASVEIIDTSTNTETAATLGAGGAYSATLTGLGDGAHVFDIVTTDKAGNSTTTALAAVDIATHAPVNGSPSESVSGLTNKTSETISATPTVENIPGNGVASVEIADTSSDTTTAATLGAGGVYSATLTGLSDGAHVFDIVTTDKAGNSTTTTLAEVDIATQTPTVDANESVSGTTALTTDVITATVTAEQVANNSIASVVVFDGDTELGPATLSDGTWSYTADDLTPGAHDFSLVTSDAAGNSTTTTLAPVNVVLPLTVSADESVSGLTDLTSDTISETATAAPGLTVAGVEVFDGDADLGAATYDAATGLWSFTAQDLSDGVHNLSTLTSDSAGDTWLATLQSVEVATAPPTVTASQSLSGLTNENQDTITETATAEAVGANAIESVEVYDGAAALGAATLSGGSWTFNTAILPDGAHRITTVTTDTAGNQTTTTLPVIHVATNLPRVKASESASGLTNQNSITVTETAIAEQVAFNSIESVEVYDGATALGAATLSGGVWTFITPTLADGVHDLSTVTTDAAGNTTTEALAPVEVATAPPAVTASQTLGPLTNQDQDTITEIATAEAVGANAIESVEVYDGATDLGAASLSAGIWTFTTGILADGAHHLETVTTDAAGTQTTTTLPVTHVGTNPPRVKASESVSGLTNQSSVTITETAIAEQVAFNAIESVEVYDGPTALGAATLSGGVWTFTTPTLTDGVHNLSTVTIDAAGNTTTKALAAVDVVTGPPATTVSQSLGRLTNQDQDTITEIATAEAVGANAIEAVEVYDGAVALGAATESGGAWTLTTGILSDGAHHLATVTTDAAGNETTTTLPAVHVGTQSPRVKASESVSGLTNQSSVTVSETAIAEAVAFNAIQSVEVYDGATALGAATLSGGVWSFTTPTLADGVHSLSTVTTDAAGNTTTKALAAVDVATTPPTVSVSQSLSGLTNKTQDTITETATAEAVGPNAIVSVDVFDGSTALGAATFSGGAWTFTTQQLAFGVHDLSTVTTDAAGNATTFPLAPINVEPPAPNVSIALVDDTSDGIDITSDDAISGGGDPGAIVQFTIDDSPIAQTAAADNAGNWTFTPTGLSEGPHTIVASESNGGGTGSATLSFTYLTTPPTVSISTPSGAVAFPSELIDGVGEAGTTVQLFDGSQQLGAPIDVGANGIWIDTVTLTGAGAHTITAADTDAANNVSVSSAITLFLDNQIIGQSDQTQVSSTTGDDRIIVDPANATVSALGGGNTVSLTSAGGATQFHLINGGGGSNTLDLSGTSGGAVVNLGLQMATGPEIGTNDVFNFQNIIGGAGPETLTLNTAPGGGTGPASGGGTPTQGGTSGGFIEAGSGDDIMTGSPGADAFIFLSAFGNDTITNFNVSGSTHDVFEVSQSLFANWSAIDGALSDTAAGAELVLNAAETVTFTGVTKAALEANSSADFRFV